MRTYIEKMLHLATGFLVIAGYLALASTERAPGLFLALPVILLVAAPFGQWLDRLFPPYRQLTAVMNMLFLVAIPLMVTRMSLLDTVTALVVYIQFYLLIHRLNERSYRYLYLMAFFLLLSASVQSPEPAIAIVLVLFLVSSVWALTLLHLKHEFDLAEASGASGGAPSVHEGPPSSSSESAGNQQRTLIAAISGVALTAFVLTAGFFLATPRIEAGLLGRHDDVLRVTGLSANINLADGGRITADTSPLMRVVLPDQPDGRHSGVMFWRAATFNYYSGSRWLSLGAGGQEHYLPPRRHYDEITEDDAEVLVREPRLGGPEVRQIIYLDRAIDEGLPALDGVRKARLISSSRRNANLVWSTNYDGTIQLAPQADGAAVTYEVWSETAVPASDSLRTAPADYEQALPQNVYRRLTNHELLPETVALARDIVTPHGTVYDRVRAVERWLTDARNDFIYSLSYAPLPSENAVDHFIHRTRMGHCELFASAMALMLRSQGIPTRVVSGLRDAEWDSNGNAYIVRSDMAHLWLEVYFIGVGWVRFDPSPPSDIETTTLGWLSRMISRRLMSAKMLWYQNVVGFDQGIQFSKLRDLGVGVGGAWMRFFTHDDEEETRPASARSATARLDILRVALAALVLVAGVATLVFLRRRETDAAALLTPDQARARRLYLALRRRLRRLGASMAGLTAEEVARDAALMPIAPREPVVDAIRAYNEARFGGRELALEQYKRIRREIGQLRRIEG